MNLKFMNKILMKLTGISSLKNTLLIFEREINRHFNTII